MMSDQFARQIPFDEAAKDLFDQVFRMYLPFGVRSFEELMGVVVCPHECIVSDDAMAPMPCLNEGGLLRSVLEQRLPDFTSAGTILGILNHLSGPPRILPPGHFVRLGKESQFKPFRDGSDALLFITRLLSVVRLFVRLSDSTASAQRTVHMVPAAQRLHLPFIARHEPSLLLPNGNLDRMMILAWRFLVAFAREAVELLHASKGNGPGPLLNGMIKLYWGIGLCPGYDLNVWRTVVAGDATNDDALQVAKEQSVRLAWSGTGPAHGMRECVRIAESIAGQLEKLPEVREFFPYSTSSKCHCAYPIRRQAYHVRCHQALRLVSLALRVLGHTAWRAKAAWMRFDRALGPDLRATPSESATYVRSARSVLGLFTELAELDPHLLDSFLTRSYIESDLPMTLVYQAERDLARHIARHGWRGVRITWGIRPGDRDDPSRCGPYIPRSSSLVGVFDICDSGLYSPHDRKAVARSSVLAAYSLRARTALMGHVEGWPVLRSPDPGRDLQLHRERVNDCYSDDDEEVIVFLESIRLPPMPV